MDVTHIFKASVMAAKLRLKKDPDSDKRRILPTKSVATSAPRDEFSRQAKEICQKITALRNVLSENRVAYMRIGQHLKSAVEMTDEQRDLIDRESEKFFTYYTQHLGQMRADWKKSKRKQQQSQHIEMVLDLLINYLRNVQQVFIDLKKYRVKHELETYRLLKYAAEKKKIPVVLGGCRNGHRSKTSSVTSSADLDERNLSDFSSDTDLEGDWLQERSTKKIEPNKKLLPHKHNTADAVTGTFSVSGTQTNTAKSLAQSPQKVALDEDMLASNLHDNDPEDMQIFEKENKELYQELQGLNEEVEQIEKNVVDIAQLQDIFSEKVSLQQYNIERIVNAVVGATENVKDANEQIKQAIQRNAGLRVWSLFFLLVMSFALLFLDWYYD